MKTYIKSIISLPAPAKRFLATEALFGLSIGLWILNLNFHLKSIGFSDQQLGIVLALATIGTAILSLFAGAVLGRIGFQRAMVIGCIAKGIGMIIVALSASFPMVLICQLLSSVGDALVLSAEFPFLLSLVSEEDRHKVYNLLMFMFLGAMIAGNIIGGYLPSLFEGYGRPFLVPLLASGVIFTIMGILRMGLPVNNIHLQTKTAFLEVLKSQKVVSYLVYAILAGFSVNLLSSMSNIIMRDVFRFTEYHVGMILSAASLASCICVFVMPMLLEKYKSSGLAVISQALGILSLVVLAFADARVFVIFWVLNAYIRGALPGVIDSPMLQSIPANIQGSYSGMRIFTNQLGQSAGAYTAGMMLMLSNYSMIMILAVIASVFQLLVYYFWCKRYLVV